MKSYAELIKKYFPGLDEGQVILLQDQIKILIKLLIKDELEVK